MYESMADMLGGTSTLVLAIVLYGATILIAARLYYLQRKSASALLSALSFTAFVFVPSLLDWVKMLGVDSFSETKAFNIDEAFFLLKTLRRLLNPMQAWQILLTLVLTCAFFVAAVVLLRRKRVGANAVWAIAAIAIVGTVSILSAHYFARYKTNTFLFLSVRDNFSSTAQAATASARDLNVVIYIGESTTSANWQLYGYPRRTTPKLSALAMQDEGLLVFDNVLSTHTHTSQSLLRALSVPAIREDGERPLPIYQRKRVSLLDVLSANGVKTRWISNQSQTGTYSLASSVIASNADYVSWSVDTKYAPNSGSNFARPFDHEFLLPEFEKALAVDRTGPIATFLHSYAGHGDYNDYVPAEFHGKVDDLLDQIGTTGVIGNLHRKNFITQSREDALVIAEIEAYDAAMSYVDSNLASIADRLNKTDRPSILVYMSDHGESVFAGRGHTVSRFIHEMVRIPFLVYFNPSAIKRYPELFKQFHSLSRSKNLANLAQFPETVFKLFGIPAEVHNGRAGIIGQGLTAQSRSIVIRDIGGRVGNIDLFADHARREDSLSDVPTVAYLQRFRSGSTGPKGCYHRANSFAKAWRAALAARCLEFDLVVTDGGQFKVTHPPHDQTGFTMDHIMALARPGQNSLWIDGKNIDNPAKCLALAEKLAVQKHPGAIMVEFPSTTRVQDIAMLDCMAALSKLGVAVSYYVPTKLAGGCADQLATSKVEWNAIDDCVELESLLGQVASSNAFSDFSFSNSVLNAMQTLPSGSALRWNTWGWEVGDVSAESNSHYHMMIFNSKNDPNHY